MEPLKPHQLEMKEYSECPDVKSIGGHIGGINLCSYCAEIYRRYRDLQGNDQQDLEQSVKLPQKTQQDQINKQTRKQLANIINDQQCGKIMCMRAGWCMCD